jgi:hypothetical protein
MAEKERKHKGSMALGKLERALEAEEQSFGDLVKLEAVGGMTIATHNDDNFPTLKSLALLPKIGGMPPPTPQLAQHMFDGHATTLGVAIEVSVFREQ